MSEPSCLPPVTLTVSNQNHDLLLEIARERNCEVDESLSLVLEFYRLQEVAALDLLIRKVKAIGSSPLDAIQLSQLSILYSYLSTQAYRFGL
jgi:hypothetical protein